MIDKTVSIIVVTWNHLRFLKECLDSILDQTYKPLEVLIIDNASTDGTTDWIQTNYPDLRLICNHENRGFSAALNEGINLTYGAYVLSVNPDIAMRPDCLEHMVNVLEMEPKAGSVSPKLLRFDNNQILDSTGLFINRARRPYDRGQGELDQGQYDHARQVFGACGALALYRREMLGELRYENEYFDEDFFAYYEDADLTWRAQLCGWRAVFEPKAIGSHVRGWGDSLRKQRKKDPVGPRLALRNRYLMTLKNDRLSSFIKDFPWIFITEVPRLLFTAFYMPSVLLGITDFIALIKPIIRKRRWMWQKTIVKESSLRAWFLKSKVMF